jgi:anti-sigma factor RsiW
MPDLLSRFRRRTRFPGDLPCRDLVELVTDYLEGALEPSESARFEAHIAACEACTMYLRQMRETLELLGEITPDSLSPAAEAELRAAFRGWSAGE